MPSKLTILRAKVSAFETGLAGLGHNRKSDGNVSIQMARQFNDILKELRTELPEVAPHLPPDIELHDRFHRGFGVTALSFPELKVMTQQALGVIDVYLAEEK